MAVQRNLETEKRAITSFQKIHGKTPDLTNPLERAQLYRIAYPTQTGLPDELKNSVNASMYSTGRMPTDLEAQQAATDKAMSERDIAKSEYKTKFNPEQQNEFGRLLQEAIKTKTNAAQTPLGESDIFKKAGLTGYATLADSLASHGEDLKFSLSEYRNLITNMTGNYKAAGETALKNYEIAANEYENEANRLNSILERQEAFKNQLELYEKQNDLQKEFEMWKIEHPDLATQMSIEKGGYDITGGKIRSKTAGQVSTSTGDTYDIGSYATDPNHEKNVQRILSSMGQMRTITDVANYIHQVAPDSPVTADMILNASEKYGVSWEMIMAIMQQDSSFGTAGKAVRTKNPGNVGNTDSGATRTYNSWQEGVDAVAKNLAGRKVSTGGVGEENAKLNNLSPLAKQIYLGQSSMDGLTPTEQGKIKKEIANNGLVLKNLSQNDKSRIDKIATQWEGNDVVKEYNTVMSDVDSLKNLGNTPTDDIQRIYTFAKVMDPTSAVKEGEYDTIQEYSTALLQRFGLKLKRVFNNSGFLTDEARNFLYNTLNNKAINKQKQYDNTRNEFGKKIMNITENAGDWTEYLTDYSIPYRNTEETYSVKAPDGKTYTFPDKQSLDNFKKEANIK